MNGREKTVAEVGVKIFVTRHLVNFFPFCFRHLSLDSINCLFICSNFFSAKLKFQQRLSKKQRSENIYKTVLTVGLVALTWHAKNACL